MQIFEITFACSRRVKSARIEQSENCKHAELKLWITRRIAYVRARPPGKIRYEFIQRAAFSSVTISYAYRGDLCAYYILNAHSLVFQISGWKRDLSIREASRALSRNEQLYINSGFIKFIATP